MRRALLLVSVAALLAAAVTLSAFAGLSGKASGTAAPGVTSTTIKLGGTFPLSGIASIYAPIPKGMDAYFKYVNSRKGPDGKKGVHGRRIVWKYYDDAYNPAQTVQMTHKLVEQDKVFAIAGSLGTETSLAVRPYLNQRKVPQALISTGDSAFGLEAKKWPWTIGWQPDYISEGHIYARWLLDECTEGEDRGLLPERQLRPGLPEGPRRRPRGEEEPDRVEGALRGDRHGLRSRSPGRSSPERTRGSSSRPRCRRSRRCCRQRRSTGSPTRSSSTPCPRATQSCTRPRTRSARSTRTATSATRTSKPPEPEVPVGSRGQEVQADPEALRSEVGSERRHLLLRRREGL